MDPLDHLDTHAWHAATGREDLTPCLVAAFCALLVVLPLLGFR